MSIDANFATRQQHLLFFKNSKQKNSTPKSRLDEKAEITILERGEYVSFANCGLPYYIGGKIIDRSDLTLQTPESFKKRFNIDIRTFSEAIAVAPASKIVTVKNLKTGELYPESYDKLVLSPGASPIIPEISGIESEKVFTLRNIPDTIKIKQYIAENNPRSAVIVGGGYIGVEMAENLRKAGLDVTIIQRSNHLIPPLDFDMAADVHKYIRAQGVTLSLKNEVLSIRESGSSIMLETQKGTVYTDMVILSVGVTPDTTFLQGSGIARNARGSIEVTAGMETSVSDIYAVGDAVTVKNYITGLPAFIPLAGPANKQGRIAADNICGLHSEYSGTQGSSVLKIFDMTVAATGLNEKTASAAGIDFDKTYTYSASHAS